jgi:hypothetical protein
VADADRRWRDGLFDPIVLAPHTPCSFSHQPLAQRIKQLCEFLTFADSYLSTVFGNAGNTDAALQRPFGATRYLPELWTSTSVRAHRSRDRRACGFADLRLPDVQPLGYGSCGGTKTLLVEPSVRLLDFESVCSTRQGTKPLFRSLARRLIVCGNKFESVRHQRFTIGDTIPCHFENALGDYFTHRP